MKARWRCRMCTTWGREPDMDTAMNELQRHYRQKHKESK
jgi:hypothetical protein